MRDYAATGLPPAYLPLRRAAGDDDSDDDDATEVDVETDELTDPEE